MQAMNPDWAKGVDVSEWQGVVNWPRVKAAGKVFAIARATYGATYRDKQFAHNWPAMRGAGILRGAYHFAVPGATSLTDMQADATRQAQAFITAIRDSGGLAEGDLPPVLDFETNAARLSPEALRSWAEVWLIEVDTAFGLTGPRASMLYSGQSFLASVIPTGVKSALSARALWLAAPGDAHPANLPAWDHWTVLQYTWQGSVDGIRGAVDLDEWSLPVAELLTMYGAAPHAQAPAEPRIMLWQHPVFEVVAQALALQYGWTATSDAAAVKTASAVLCIGGAPDWIAQAKADCTGQWHEPLAGTTLWATLALIAQAGETGKF